jgi:hypothetical protein
MRRRAERISQQAARGDNYASHFESRQLFKNFPAETQDLYRRVSASLPQEWTLNEFGAVDLSEENESRMIYLALQNHLPHAWYLIPFFQSEEGWDDCRKKFEALPEPEKTFPEEKFVKSEVVHMGVDN